MTDQTPEQIAAARAAADAAAGHWTAGLDAETKGYAQNRGLDKKTAAEAFFEASKAHREAERLIGAPANEMIRLPKDPNAPEWKDVYKRLGVPGDEKDYDFSTVKRAGDKPLDDALSATLRQASLAGHLTKDGATQVAAQVVKHLDGIESAKAADDAANLLKEKAALKANWGANEAANMVVARAAVTALGIKPETVSALEKVAGYAAVMEMFRNIGSKIGEDRFIQGGPNAPAGGAMTRDQAVSEKEALKKDVAWRNRYLAGGVEEKRKMDSLDRIILGVSSAA